jgi:peroxiredoxin
VQIVGISADTKEESLEFADKLKIPFPLLSDTGMRVMSAYGVADTKRDIAVPAVFIVNRDSTVIWRYVGDSITDTPSAKKLLEVIDTQ